MAVARFCRILVIIAGRILKRLVGQIRGDQFFSERIREGSHRGTKAGREGKGGKPEGGSRNQKFENSPPRASWEFFP